MLLILEVEGNRGEKGISSILESHFGPKIAESAAFFTPITVFSRLSLHDDFIKYLNFSDNSLISKLSPDFIYIVSLVIYIYYIIYVVIA
jgi:hypothetical protein